jgi:diguanylate cyclase (GGDEF)-like protein
MSVADDDKQIQNALEELNRLILARVDQERRRDQLTGLPNGLALEERVNTEANRNFWVAFIEIDKFKSVNDQFGYENADELLKAVSKLIEELAASFPGEAQAFRQHGDEFFIVGAHDEKVDHRTDALAVLFEMTRSKVAAIKVPVHAGSTDPSVTMTCTVSIGWLVADDVPGVRTFRNVLARLERAVDAAKRTRNAVVRYEPVFERRVTVSLRADCPECATKFSADIPTRLGGSTCFCPGCRAELERPPPPNETFIDPIVV